MGQQVEIAQPGWDNVAVAVDGDYNTITISRGVVELVLFQRHLRRREVRTDLDLLHPEARTAVPLVGRGEDLAALQAWLDTPRLVAARCVIGQGGSGKTRLAIELCERAEAAGWHAGFVTYDELTRFTAQQNLASWRWPGSMLLVIDYAATGALVIRRWLEQLSRLDPAKAPPDRRLRLLLLERHADPGHGWWAELTRAGTMGMIGVRDLLDPDAEPVPLLALGSVDHRRALLERVMGEANGLRPEAAPVRPPPAGADPTFEAELGNAARNNEPLYLMMAGLAAVQHRVPHLLALGRTDLACRLAEGEVERIRRLAEARDLDGELLAHLAAVVTLADGLDVDRLTDAVGQECQTLGTAQSGGPAKVVKALADALPSRIRHHVDAVRPDLIGEAAILHFVDAARYTPAQQAALVERTWRLAPEKTTASVIHTAQDFAADEREHPSLLWLDRLIGVAPSLDVLNDIARAMPESTVALRERAATVQGRIVEGLRPHGSGPEEARALLASAIGDLGVRLGELGRREEALATAQEAAGLYRALAAARPDAFRPDLAGSLSVLADCLEKVGRVREAVGHDRESVAALAPMFERYPEAFAGRMLSYARDYIRRAEASGVEPDRELLGPIAERLAAVMGGNGGEEERG